MRIIENLYIQNYKNIKELSLKSFKDLNIIIGPNNCGKTSILESINCLKKMDGSSGSSIDCKNNLCPPIQRAYNRSRYAQQGFEISNLSCTMQESDQYLRKYQITLKYLFSSELIDDKFTDAFTLNWDQFFSNLTDVINSTSDIPENKKQEMIKHLLDRNEDKPLDSYNPRYTLIVKQFETTGTRAPIPDISIYNFPVIFEFIKDKVCFIEGDRLHNYKNEDTLDYLRDKNLSGQQLSALISFLNKIVDSNIEDYKQHSLDLKRTDGFITSIYEQGSGVRSLFCLAVDILSAETGSIILIDEPELGLNPYAKQEFLKFLFKESKEKQIFIATHDPTFVNPLLWKADSTAVYSHSLISDSFIKVNLDENKNDPATFAGYLPHTTSMKSIHIYVEGSSDVYIFQIYLRKYLKNNFKNWSEKLNDIGIYHLNGENWKHILSTIPKTPYISAIILDGDKKEDASKVCDSYNMKTDFNFKFCSTRKEFEDALINTNHKNNLHPVYCLRQKGIESYLDKELRTGIENYNKKIHGPEIAEKMEHIPDEFIFIFESLINNTSSK